MGKGWGWLKIACWLLLVGYSSFAIEPLSARACHQDNAAPFVESQQQPDGTLMTWIVIPAQSAYRVVASLPPTGLQPVRQAQEADSPKVWAAINGGFFDPANGLTTSHVKTMTGTVVAPQDNPRLWKNPSLTSYLPAIANRSEFRTLQCGSRLRYQIARHEDTLPTGCSTVSLVGAGPQLLPLYDPESEAFRDPTTGRDPIGVNRADARSAVGVRADGTVILMVAGQTVDSNGTVRGGLSLPQLARWLSEHGVVQALNLDGGSSASLWSQQGAEVLGKRNRQGEPVRRAVLSTLQVQPIPSR